MTPRRKQTNEIIFDQDEQPVRFYKYIALSFLFITIILLGVIVLMSSKKATITVAVKPEIVETKDTLILGSGQDNLNSQVTTVEVISQKVFNPTEGREDEAVATGEVILHNESNLNQPLVATTRLLSPDGILFRLKDRVVVPAKGNITVAVYADKPGRSSEIAPTRFTIPGLSLDKQTEIYATSEKPMIGGVVKVGVLGVNDWQKAQDQLLADLEKQGQEKLSQLYPDKTLVYKMLEPEFTSSNKIGDEVSEFTLSGKVEVVGVFYDLENVQKMVQSKLKEQIIKGDEILSVTDSLTSLAVGHYDASSTLATVDVFGSGIITLDPESKQLEKNLFFGKNRDEVRRYLLSLDHVDSVEVKFSPAWMLSVPHLSEHISIIVKNI